ncbi:hypothetical protein Clacol_008788 [Clathrus columnatus]|uniref:Aldehyde dehydrogenase n=1 Tax=Clathrus columnatus TaxID=1419009 RepID=A0AAV5AN12_9AGAM|nr:hypothetical protein Clacol_008788 [Clathrus columnatus]
MSSSSSTLVYTPIEEISKIHASLKENFNNGTGKLADINYRKNQLLQLGYIFQDNFSRWEEALAKDMGRPRLDSYMCVLYAYNNVNSWAKPSGPSTWNYIWAPLSPTILKEPKGVVLYILPFNLPIWTLTGLAGAIAAGCPCVIKPSELTPASAALMAELFPKYLDQDLYRIVNGGVEETTKLLELPWDHIMYTGSGRVGRIVATAAAKHLTPITLELGGKSPAIVDSTANISLSARRIFWGKVMNCGQICVAPDYVIVTEDVKDEFIKECEAAYKSFFPEGPEKSESFSRIISEGHTQRLKNLIDQTRGEIVFGGDVDIKARYVSPTLVKNVALDDVLMQDEIFGPVLSVVSVKNAGEAIRIINGRERPLALYIFSNDSKLKKFVLENTLSGSVVVNDVVIQGGCHLVPFGGTGASGCLICYFTSDTRHSICINGQFFEFSIGKQIEAFTTTVNGIVTFEA